MLPGWGELFGSDSSLEKRRILPEGVWKAYGMGSGMVGVLSITID